MRCGLYISCKIDAVGSFTAEVNCPQFLGTNLDTEIINLKAALL